jgi:hypothetical protein
MRPKLQKQSALKLVGRIIPQSGGYETPQFAVGFHTRGLSDISEPLKCLAADS